MQVNFEYHPTNFLTKMAVTDLFASEIAVELLKVLMTLSRKSFICRSSAEQLIYDINEILPTIQEIKRSGVELPQLRQSQLDHFSEMLRGGCELAEKVINSGRWNVYKNLQLARKMEKFEKNVSKFIKGIMPAHILADVHHVRVVLDERFDRMEKMFGGLNIGSSRGGVLFGESMKRMEVEEVVEGGLVSFGVGMVVGKKKVIEMIVGRDELRVVGITGIGGSGKTTLARDICTDEEVKRCFDGRILFLTVSQSPNVERLREEISRYLSGNSVFGSNHIFTQWSPPFDGRIGVRTLIVLDDVWTLAVLQQLVFNEPGCKTLVVSRFRFPSTVLNSTYELELLREDEAISLFCHSAFGQKFIPPTVNEDLVKQVVEECKGLPLAIKVIGASLRDQPEKLWASAKSKLARGVAVSESHQTNVLDRMAVSVHYLSDEVRECFLDLGAFPEDKKIPVDVLINMWVEIHDMEEVDAFGILVELSKKNLLTLVKGAWDGDLYSSYYDISVTQHDVLRDLALHLSNHGNINKRRRLLMPKRESKLPKEWERNADQPFNALVVSIHTGEMKDTDWFHMEFPKAEVLILNFSSSEYSLPPFINNMPKLRALILVNHGNVIATLYNKSTLNALANLRSLWFEKIYIPRTTIPLKNLQKISLILCGVENNLDTSVIDLSYIFPSLLELAIDHCDNLIELPSSISKLHSLKSLSITNCHGLHELPDDLGKLKCLEVLRLYACPYLRRLPSSMCELVGLKFLDISQCVNLNCLPDGIGGLMMLEKIDMRECLHIRNLPASIASLQSLRHVVCDEDVSRLWKGAEKTNVQVAKESFNLDWLSE